MGIERAFQTTNDQGISTEQQVLYLLENGINTLFYQGNLDLACNTAGNIRWAGSMAWKGQPEFVAKDAVTWVSGGKKAGWFKEVNVDMNGKTTRFAFVTHYQAGHMVSVCLRIPKLRFSRFRRFRTISRSKRWIWFSAGWLVNSLLDVLCDCVSANFY